MAATKAWAGMLPVALLLSACQATDGGNVFEKPFGFLSAQAEKIQALGGEGAVGGEAAEVPQQKTLAVILMNSAASVDLGKGFTKSIAAAVMIDPSIIAAADEVDALAARVDATRSQKDFQFDGRLYGGVEDASDDTSGVAAVLTANRMIFDGGKINAQISADEQRLIAARHSLQARIDERALQLASIWVDLDRYENLLFQAHLSEYLRQVSLLYKFLLLFYLDFEYALKHFQKLKYQIYHFQTAIHLLA